MNFLRRLPIRLLFSLIVLLALIVFIFAAAEIWIRATSCYGTRATHNDYIAHPVLGWVGRPNMNIVRSLNMLCAKYRYNRFGFRGPDRPLPKPPDTLRIVVLGDSFLEGYHFPDEELMTTHLEKLVAEKTGRPTEVINLGVSGWGTGQELLAYQQLGRHFQPDVVLLLFSSCNDIINGSRKLSDIYKERMQVIKPYFYLEDGELKLMLPPKRLVKTINRFAPERAKQLSLAPWELMTGFPRVLCQFRFGYWLYTRWDRPSRLRLLLDSWHLVPFKEPLYATTWGESGYYRGLSLRFWIYSRMPDPAWHEAIMVEQKLISGLAKLVAQYQSQFLLVSGANIEQVDPDIWELTLRTQPRLKLFQLDLDFPEKAMRTFTDQNRLAYLPLVPAFRKAQQNGEELFLRGDGHWNADGQRLAAEAIADYLLANHFLSPAP